MRFDSEFETLISWIEGHMTFVWRILENNTSRSITKPWQWNITKHHVNHDKPWWNTTTHHETSQNIMNHYKAPLIITICAKIIVNYPQKNVLQHEYILFPYNIYLYQKNLQTGICLRKGPKPHLLYFFYSKSSPTLKTNRRPILTKLTYGRDLLPRNFPISWYCKLDTGMHKPNIHPELEMQ